MKPFPSLLIALASLAPAGAGAEVPEDALDLWLARLASGSANERESAQRWLSVNLETSDFPRLALEARRADAEMARRLALALAAEDRHLGLAVLLQGESSRELVAIGDAAFEELATRWCPGSAGKSASRRTVEMILESRAETVLVSKGGPTSAGELVDSYDRQLGFGLPLVTLPALAGREFKLDSMAGNMLEHLGEFCSDHGLTMTGIGSWEGELPGANAWILISPLSGARSRSGAERLAGWCRSVERGSSDARESALALAATGWPAALQWLDQRWTGRGDLNALEGLILAAGKGRVASSLRRPALRAELLERADRVLDSMEVSLDGLDPQSPLEREISAREAERIARALIGAGPMTLGGEGRPGTWFDSWSELNDAQRWLRLFVLEGQRAGTSAERTFLMSLIGSSSAGPVALRMQALRALAAFPPGPLQVPRIAQLEKLVGWSIDVDEEAELLIVLGALGVEPSEEDFGRGTDEQRFLVAWRLSRGEAEQAAKGLLGCLGRSSLERRELSDRMESWRLEYGPGFLKEVVDLSLALATDEDRQLLAELALLGGCLGARAQRSFYETLKGEAQPSARELEWLGALVAGPDGVQAERLLMEILVDLPGGIARRNGLVKGLNRAVRGLREAGLDERSRNLIQAVWEQVAESDSPLLGRLGPPGWPRIAPPEVLALQKLERRLPSSLLGH